jgi:hypothetical protein
MRLRSYWLTTLAAIHIEPPWFLLSSRVSLEDTPVEAISFPLFAKNSARTSAFAAAES